MPLQQCWQSYCWRSRHATPKRQFRFFMLFLSQVSFIRAGASFVREANWAQTQPPLAGAGEYSRISLGRQPKPQICFSFCSGLVFFPNAQNVSLAVIISSPCRAIGFKNWFHPSTLTVVGVVVVGKLRFLGENGIVITQIEARDQHEVIVCGLHKRAVICTESFSRRVKGKVG